MAHMVADTLKRLFSGFVPILLLSGLLLVSLYLMSDATLNSEQFGRLYSWLLILNAMGVLVLVVLIGGNLYRLLRNYRARVTGSRMTVRLLVMFVVLSVLPVVVVYSFSVSFLLRGIDSWFDVRIEHALQDALDLSRSALDGRMREMLRDTEDMAIDLTDASGSLAALLLNDLREQSGAAELTLFTASRIIAASGADPIDIVPDRPDNTVLSYFRQSGNYVALDPIQDAGLHVRVVVSVPSTDPRAETHILQALFPVPARQSTLADSVQQAYGKYNELVYLRKPLKYSFILTLSLVLLLALLTAVWAAFFSARRMAQPVRDLAEGTRAVAEGDYSRRLPRPAVDDELGFLVRSFNDMTQRVAAARDDVRRSQQQAEGQRAYLETLLGGLSSGVLSLDAEHTLRIVNTAASQILGLDLSCEVGTNLHQLMAKHPELAQFVESISPELAEVAQEWRAEITLFGATGRQVLMCRGAILPAADGGIGGHVIVFDDITRLIQAQRDAAWGEVARRLAHEIKNPLTPIQLSAERLRRKCLDSMEPELSELLDRSTHTIIQQVEQMQEMVNAFSQYARAPQLKLQALDLNNVVSEVLDLYGGAGAAARIEVNLDSRLPPIEADDGRMRQLLHNLIKNAQEAVEGGAEGCVTITTCCMEEASCQYVELRVDDNGSGIPDDIMSQIFEPYVTTKARGTGLGLAIVKRIVEEHGGMLRVENLTAGGASVSVRLPVAAGIDGGDETPGDSAGSAGVQSMADGGAQG